MTTKPKSHVTQSPSRNIRGLTAYRGMWHSHIQGGFPGFREAREACRKGGYQFLGLTEHDNRYIEIEWPEKDWYDGYDDGFLFIRGFEATHPIGHITCLGFLPDQTGVDVWAAHRRRFERAELDAGYDGFLRRASALGAFLALNHPHAWRGRTRELLAHPDLDCLDAMEFYNGNQTGKTWQQGYTMDLYDACLTAGCRLWGGANPDCHSWDPRKPDGPFNGYSVVWAHALTRAAILESLKLGRYYLSTGLHVNEWDVDTRSIRVGAESATSISFYGIGGRLLDTVSGDRAEYWFRGEESYVRTHIQSDMPSGLNISSEPVQAWMNPVWLSN